MAYVYNASTKVRVIGLASGIDTDSLIASIMEAKSAPLNKLKQQKTLNEWRQEAYREITNAIKGFYDSYLNVTSSQNMRNASSIKVFTSKVTNSSGAVSSGVSVSATTAYQGASHTIKVIQLATSAKEVSQSKVSNLESGSLTEKLSQGLDLSGKSLEITIDGTKKTITFVEGAVYTDGESLKNDLQNMINTAFGKGIGGLNKVEVKFDGASGKLSFDTVEGSGSIKVTINSAGENSALEDLEIKNGASNRVSASLSLESLKDTFKTPLQFGTVDENEENEVVSFRINGKEFTFSKNTKLSDIINQINSDKEANVTITYSSTTDKFTIVSDQTGAGQNIKIENIAGNFFEALGFDIDAENFGSNGTDAIAEIDGVAILSSQNSITQDGVTYTLHAADNEELTVTFTQDVNAAYDRIKAFVDEYNKLITLIYSKINEKYDKSYQPLTDSQKEAMKEKDIEMWEKKAKTGLLYNDPTLSNFLTSLRNALISSIDGVGLTLSKIGIESKSYRDNGVLTIDEEKLKKALAEDLEGVTQLFTKVSDTVPNYTRKLTAEEKATRFSESGLATRIYDIIQDNISTMRDSNGNKGKLIQIAGLEGDPSVYDNNIYKAIKDLEEKISAWEEKLMKIEDDLYAKYAKMEKAMQQLNSTSNWLSLQIDAWNRKI